MTSTPLPEHQLDHYEIIHPLGRGAMGTVYLARDRRIGRRVALKMIHLAPNQFEDETAANEFYRRLQREAEVCGSLMHPNIVTLYEAGYENGRISYLAMEYIEGETLRELMRRSGPVLPVSTVLDIGADVLRGLEYAHRKGIIHRDIKPANILITADGMAKIADFGIARPQNSSMTRAGALMGTPNYMAPEQVVGHELTPRADIFSFGVMLFELLTGGKPFTADDLTGILRNILEQPAPHVSDIDPTIPRPVGNFIARLLAKSSEERPNASEALAQLDALRAPASASAPPVVPSARSRRALYVSAAALGLFLLFVMGILIVAKRSESKPSGVILPEQMSEFAAKRRALDEAKALYDAGRYAESLQKYEAYLQKHPYSTVAREGRDRSREALERVSARKPRHKSRHEEDISPSELLNRLKRAIRRK